MKYQYSDLNTFKINVSLFLYELRNIIYTIDRIL